MVNTIVLLSTAFDEFMKQPFPRGSENRELYELYPEFVEYDGFIAGLISTLLSGGKIDRDRLYFDVKLKGRLERIIANGDPSQVDKAREYLDYLMSLKKLIDLAEHLVK